ncbi:hypothetical protein LCGC14_2742650 [marine sediment metagenome]|uniref:Uncharacterized protein n=1 Tax=marine sediment metagenome TaxID=412755 RepID=A0A0F9BVR5_9ZZZZ
MKPGITRARLATKGPSILSKHDAEKRYLKRLYPKEEREYRELRKKFNL